jgi:hypothetical protein
MIEDERLGRWEGEKGNRPSARRDKVLMRKVEKAEDEKLRR